MLQADRSIEWERESQSIRNNVAKAELLSSSAPLVSKTENLLQRIDSSHHACIYTDNAFLTFVPGVSHLCVLCPAPRQQGRDPALRETFSRERASCNPIHHSGHARADRPALHLRVLLGG